MSSNRVATRPPRGPIAPSPAITDADRIAGYLEDAAHVPGGHADSLFLPRNEAEIAVAVQASRSVLVVGAQSSLTGGATPRGGAIISTARLTGIELLDGHREIGRAHV